MSDMKMGRKYGWLMALLLWCCTSANAEVTHYFMEAGATGGGTFYLGDANGIPFTHMDGVGGAFLKYHLDKRWSFGVLVNGGRVEIPAYEENEALKRGFVDAEAIAEFNFFDYGYDKLKSQTRGATPYIFVGLGCTFYKGCAFEIPFGVGGKFKLSEQCNMYITWSMNKLFKDDFDGISNPRGLNKSVFINNDWYSKITVSFSVDFWKYCMTCQSGMK